jgi:hypothetical protein
MFEALRTAADCSNADEVNIAAKNFWAADFGAGRTFSEWLGRQKRPALLKAISQFAPLIGTVGTGGEIVGTVRAIRNVCRWWP